MIEQTEIAKLSENFLSIIDIKNRRYRGFTYRNVFVGSETVDSMIETGMASSRSEAVAIGRRLEKELRFFSHVSGHHLFKDAPLFYRVSEKDSLVVSSCQVDKELLMDQAQKFLNLANVKDRKYRFKKYKKCFVGSEIIDAMVYTGLVQSRQEGVLLGRALEHHLNWFRHVTGDHHFRDDYLFYRFNLEAHVSTSTSPGSVAPMTSIAPSRVSTDSSLSSSWSRSSPKTTLTTRRTKELMMNKIQENLRANDYSEVTITNLKLVMSELKHKTSKMYKGDHKVIETRAGSDYKPPAPLSSDIVFRPPSPVGPEITVVSGVSAATTVNKNLTRQESYYYDEFTILEGTSDDESLYVEETIAEEEDEDAYQFETRLSWLSAGGISAITT